eukprot:CAMPEP_0168341486 /NCGR_PEP_ID=MMETSP0213-20121227/14722_1 /TAXON_ID=151035 /ORGANISM="Euplotes harpa, Strain FSP1.4" /LENGTH=184 /DNA_ID=CAMNT_0008347991 /DNA_START=126 /DNA_END=681 /DNA_ORIENTATION=-
MMDATLRVDQRDARDLAAGLRGRLDVATHQRHFASDALCLRDLGRALDRRLNNKQRAVAELESLPDQRHVAVANDEVAFDLHPHQPSVVVDFFNDVDGCDLVVSGFDILRVDEELDQLVFRNGHLHSPLYVVDAASGRFRVHGNTLFVGFKFPAIGVFESEKQLSCFSGFLEKRQDQLVAVGVR